jgi:peptide/nickel transport system permease protein
MSDLVTPGLEAPDLGKVRSSTIGARRFKWIAQRLGLGVVTLFVVSWIIFLATRLLPGDAAQVILGQQASPERVALLRADLGLDRSAWSQYSSWIGGVLTGDFGTSLSTGGSAWERIAPRLENSASLLLATSLIAIPLSFLVGILAALRPNGWLDTVINFVSITLAGLPEFVIGIGLVLGFSTTFWKIFPATSIVTDGSNPFTRPSIVVLPVVTLVLAVIPYLGRLIRASLIDSLNSEYVVAARLKGLSPRVVLLRHALPNGLAPSIQATGLTLSFLLGGVVVIEFLFQYPGLGSLLLTAIDQRDIILIQSIVLIFAAGYVLFNLVADVLTMLVTPRLRTK